MGVKTDYIKNIDKTFSFLKNQSKLDDVNLNKPLSFKFKKSENENLYYSFHNVQIVNSWVDENQAIDNGVLEPYFTMHEVKVKL